MIFILHMYCIYWYKSKYITITDADFPAINLNGILMIVAHFRTHQNDQMSITAYSVAMNFLKDEFDEVCRCDSELAHLFRTKKILAKINYKLPEAKIMAEGPIDELGL